MERQVPRRRAVTFGAARPEWLGGVRHRLVRLRDLYESWRRPAELHQLRHRARRFHVARPCLLQPETQRGQRRGQPRRRERQPQLELWSSRVRRRPGILALRARQQRNFLSTSSADPGRADAVARRRARPHPAWQQQRVLPGQRDHLGSTGKSDDRAHGVHAPATRPACRAPRLLAVGVLHRSGAGRRTARHRLADPGCRPDDRRRLAPSSSRSRSRSSSTATGSPTTDERGEEVNDDSFLPVLQRPTGADRLQRCPRRARGHRGRSSPEPRPR